jgi:hypothetical protein
MGDPLLLVDYAVRAVAKVAELLQQTTEVDGNCRELLPAVKSMGDLLQQIRKELGSVGSVPDAVPEALQVRPVPLTGEAAASHPVPWPHAADAGGPGAGTRRPDAHTEARREDHLGRQGQSRRPCQCAPPRSRGPRLRVVSCAA